MLMTAGSAIPISLESSAVTNVFELLLLISLWLTVREAGLRPHVVFSIENG
ncbi:hypothetical protein P4H39_12395 [Paenibacillus lautus]|uniref:hypothetical protein n=1 Tax=Paenibacillus lautus TaxID=1401 RepID=UPI002DBEEAB5|nr:hypothetical protein [Paenibacillus lautus]MEC0203436.1 hypothetical protein [Paenibacillus lautus]